MPPMATSDSMGIKFKEIIQILKSCITREIIHTLFSLKFGIVSVAMDLISVDLGTAISNYSNNGIFRDIVL